MNDAGQPIEPLIRAEATPTDAIVVIRGGPITAAKLAEHAQRQQSVFTYRGDPMVAVSVDLVLPGWTLDQILQERMWSRSTYATTTVAVLRNAGYELVPTSASPHYSVLMPNADESSATELLVHFGPMTVNRFKQRRR